jgi:hypothetical protein
MSTRNNIMVIDRKHSSKFEEGFAISPYSVADKAYVNMYHHHDGYPQWQGVQIANWLLAKNNGCQDGERLTAKLVHDMYYDSCYLQRIDHFQSDIEYIYVIWSGDRDKIHVTCWNVYLNKCEFVLTPEKIISKYMDDMEYTDFTNNETRFDHQNKRLHSEDDVRPEEYSKKEIADFNKVMSHARQIIDILTHED